MFELCKFWPSPLPVINSRADHWITSALFLAWDRHVLDGGVRKKSNLIALIDNEELYKLLGMNRDYVLARARVLVELYRDAGHLDRFSGDAKASVAKKTSRSKQLSKEPMGINLEWLDQEESDRIVERHAVERRVQKRDRKKSAALKRRYDNACQLCGTRLGVGEERYYSEAAHIKGLGEPHNGPDVVANMLILCPNHHLQFDRGVLRLRKVGPNYLIQAKAVSDPLNGKAITLKHILKNKYVKHHYDWFQ